MKIAAVFFLCIFAFAHSLSILSLFNQEWNNFKLAFGKRYNNVEEEKKRMNIYMENSEKILQHNRLHALGLSSYKLKMNKFGDMDTTEVITKYNGLKQKSPSNSGVTFIPPANVELPDHVDWRIQGAVTEVKDQKDCGSCWSFASTGALEGQQFRKTNKLVSLSEQNLIDCSGSFGNEGCGGGSMIKSYNYVMVNNGIDTEKYYPYKGDDEPKCLYNSNYSAATDHGYIEIQSGNETALKAAVATIGPISVGIDASHRSFLYYEKGIYDDDNCLFFLIDHAVLVVGYGTTKEGVDYWIVKNSWGSSWGDNGYIYMSRNKNNQCGISTVASYPLV